MKISFDEFKHLSNIAKHGIGFEEAIHVLLDPKRLDYLDQRKDYGKERRITFGNLRTHVFVVVYVIRDKKIRVISMRKANEREKKNIIYLEINPENPPILSQEVALRTHST